MFGVKNRNETFGLQSEKKRKSLIIQQKPENFKKSLLSNTNTTISRYLNPPKKRNVTKKGFSTLGWKNAAKPTKQFKDYSKRSQLRQEIRDLERSLICLTKTLEENRRKQNPEVNPFLKMSQLQEETVSQFPATTSTTNTDSKRTANSYRKKIFVNKTGLFGDGTTVDKSRKFGDYSRKRIIKRTISPKGPFTQNTRKLYNHASSHDRPIPTGNSRSSKKIDERLERVKTFIQSLHKTDYSSPTCTDGMNHKDTPSKKNSSTNMGSSSAEGIQTKDDEAFKPVQQRKPKKNTYNRIRVLVSRPPLLETILEEPEKEEEEAKYYDFIGE